MCRYNKATAAKWYSLGAEQGDVDAQLQLGMLYKNGDGVTRDYTLAVRWLKKAADNGNATAQNNLAGCYRNGQVRR